MVLEQRKTALDSSTHIFQVLFIHIVCVIRFLPTPNTCLLLPY
jgi:hypothetical protein